ncbi:MAG: head GIN domain-containing protein [bacterium]
MNNLVMILVFIAFILLMATVLGGNFCSWICSDKIISEIRNVGDFNKIDFKLVGSLEIVQGSNESVKIEADDNIIPIIETVVEDGVLKVRMIKWKCFRNVKKLKVCVSVKNLCSIKNQGVGSIEIKKLQTPSLTLILSGVGSLNVQDLETDSLDAQLTGVGSVNINSGMAKKQIISISGCGSFNGQNLVGTTGVVTVSGCGSAKVNIQDISYNKTGVGSIKNFAEKSCA